MYGSLRYAQNQYAQAVLTYTPIIIPLPTAGNYSYAILTDIWGIATTLPAILASDYAYSIQTDSFGIGRIAPLETDTWGTGPTTPTYSETTRPGPRPDYSYAIPTDIWGVGELKPIPTAPGEYSYAIIQERFGGESKTIPAPTGDIFGAGKSTAVNIDQFGG